jgi:hypothetical protein
MQPRALERGEIVQVNPGREAVARFGACLLVVTESKPWGAIAYAKNAGSPGLAFFRALFADIEPTGGRVAWVADCPKTGEEGWEAPP